MDIQSLQLQSGIVDYLATAESPTVEVITKSNHIEQQVKLLTRLMALYRSLGEGGMHTMNWQPIHWKGNSTHGNCN